MNTDPTAILAPPDADVVLEEFNNLVDVLEQAESDLRLKTESAKEAKAAVNHIEEALRAKAREMRRPTELPLLANMTPGAVQ